MKHEERRAGTWEGLIALTMSKDSHPPYGAVDRVIGDSKRIENCYSKTVAQRVGAVVHDRENETCRQRGASTGAMMTFLFPSLMTMSGHAGRVTSTLGTRRGCIRFELNLTMAVR